MIEWEKGLEICSTNSSLVPGTQEFSAQRMKMAKIQNELTLSNTSEGTMVLSFFNKGSLEQREMNKKKVKAMIGGILIMFNAGLKVSPENKMDEVDIFEATQFFFEELKYMRLEDLVLCLQMAKTGRLGAIFNRVDTMVLSEFWSKYRALYAANFESDKLYEKSQYGTFNTEAQTIAIKEERIMKQKQYEKEVQERVRKSVNRAEFNTKNLNQNDNY